MATKYSWYSLSKATDFKEAKIHLAQKPFDAYKSGKPNQHDVLVSVQGAENGKPMTTIVAEIFDMNAPVGIRNLNLVLRIHERGIISLVKGIGLKASFQVKLTPELFPQLWRGKPVQLLRTINSIEKAYSKNLRIGHVPWTEDLFAEKLNNFEKKPYKLTFEDLFKLFPEMFA